jgi:hypothetical protein
LDDVLAFLDEGEALAVLGLDRVPERLAEGVVEGDLRSAREGDVGLLGGDERCVRKVVLRRDVIVIDNINL